MINLIFKEGDIVFHFRYGWGSVVENHGDSSTVSFNRGHVFSGNDLLSFKEYTLFEGGFSQVRPDVVKNTSNAEAKTKRKYVPFTIEDAELFRDRWVESEFGSVHRIQRYGNLGVGITNNTNFSFKRAFEKLKFDDGTPFGKLA